MRMVVVVRALPDAVRRKRIHAENFKNDSGSRRFMQDGMMLMIVINNEHAGNQQAAENAAENFRCQVDIPDRTRKTCHHQEQRRKRIKPTFQAILYCKFLCSED